MNDFFEQTTTSLSDEDLLQRIDEVEVGKLAVADFVAIIKTRAELEPLEFIDRLVSLLWIKGSQSLTGDANRSKQFSLLLKELIHQSVIDLNTVKLSLEIGTLVDVGVIRETEDNFQKRLVKTNTSFVYKQQKYNILREETEGYAKMVALASQLPNQMHHLDGAVRNVQSLIGQFDLDPNRVLDILLDAFEQQLDNLLLLELLRIFRVPNIVHILGFKFLQFQPPTTAAGDAGAVSSQSTSEALKQAEADPHPSTPATLFSLAAALIMFNLVDLSELLSYIVPTIDKVVETLREEEKRFQQSFSVNSFSKDQFYPNFLKKEWKLRSGSSFSTVSAAVEVSIANIEAEASKVELNVGSASKGAPSANGSSTAVAGSKPPPPTYPPPKSIAPSSSSSNISSLNEKTSGTADSPETAEFRLFSSSKGIQHLNQYLGLANALIRFRGWSQAKRLLDPIFSNGVSQDFLLIYCPEIRDALAELLAFSLKPLADKSVRTVPAFHRRHGGAGKVDSETGTGLMTINTLQPQFPLLKEVTGFPTHCLELVELLGYHLAENNVCFVRVCVALKSFLQSQSLDSANFCPLDRDTQQSLSIALVLLHCLSVSGADATYFSHQLWQALKLFPFSLRFSLYDAWRQSSTLAAATISDLKTKTDAESAEHLSCKKLRILYGFAVAEKNSFQSCRRELKRLAKDNTKAIGRSLAKNLHANPIGAIMHILNQIEAFDNLIPHVIEALKYSLDLSRDVFASQILLQLKKLDNDGKLKAAGQSTHYSPWFVALSKFIGTFYCRYPATELTGLLHYLLDSLGQQNQSADLLVIKDLLGIMGGCDTLTNVSNSQLEGLAGGKTLRGEVLGNTTSIKSGLSSVSSRKSSVILREEMIRSGTALPLLLFIAQMRNQLLFDGEMRHLKLISHLFDVAQDLLVQFTEFLVFEAKSLESIARMMPSIEELHAGVGLSIPIIFQLIRPLMRAALQSSPHSSTAPSIPSHLISWHPFSDTIQKSLSSFNQTVSDDSRPGSISNDLFLFFWLLTLSDIYTPTERYQTENKRIKDRFTELDSKKESQSSLNLSSSEYSKYCKNRDAEMKNMMVTMTSLQEELNSQKRHVEAIKDLLSERRDSLVLRSGRETDHVDPLLQDLVFHRLLLSPVDSIYCTKFMKVLHDLSVPNFSLLASYHSFFEYFLPQIFSCTECEASFLGYAIDDVLTVIHRWQQSQSLFQLEALQIRATNSSSSVQIDDLVASSWLSAAKRLLAKEATAEGAGEEIAHEATESLDSNFLFQQFQEISKKWHSMLYSSIVAAINGKEYIYIRSSFVILSKISSHFPFYRKEGNLLLSRVEEFIKEETREDLQIMARSLLIPLRKHQNNWINDLPKTNPSPSPARLSSSAVTNNGKSFAALSQTYSKSAREKDGKHPAARSGDDAAKKSTTTDPPRESSSQNSLAQKRTVSTANLQENLAPPQKHPRSEVEDSLSLNKEKGDKGKVKIREKGRDRSSSRSKSATPLPPPPSLSLRATATLDSKADGRSKDRDPPSRERDRQQVSGPAKRSREEIPDRRSRSQDRDYYRNRGSLSSSHQDNKPPLPPPLPSSDRLRRIETDSALHRVSNLSGRDRGNSSGNIPRYDEKDRSRPPPPPSQPPLDPPRHHYDERSRGGNPSNRDHRPPPPPLPPSHHLNSHRDQDNQYYKKQRR